MQFQGWQIVDVPGNYRKSSLLLNQKCLYSLTWPDNKRNNCVKTSHCTTCGTTLPINTIKVNVITFPEIHQKKLFLSFVCVNNYCHCLIMRKVWDESRKPSFDVILKWTEFQGKNQCERVIWLSLVWSGTTSVAEKLLISGYGCWWK